MLIRLNVNVNSVKCEAVGQSQGWADGGHHGG